jgi:hypothetical protein
MLGGTWYILKCFFPSVLIIKAGTKWSPVRVTDRASNGEEQENYIETATGLI